MKEPITLPIAEVILKRPIQDFETKFIGEDNLISVVPAKLPKQIVKKIRGISKLIYQKLGWSGFLRLDLRIKNMRDIYILENNTIPGMLDESDFPKLLKQANISENFFFK